METCAKAVIGRIAPEPKISEVIYSLYCFQCGRVIGENLHGKAADSIARAHSAIHGHDVEIRYSIIDCPMETIRAEDMRR